MLDCKYLIYQRPLVRVTFQQNFGPEIGITTSNQVSRFALEQAVLVANADQFTIALTTFVSDAGEMRIALLAVLAYYPAVVKLIFSAIHINISL